jgi:hypothetical protein
LSAVAVLPACAVHGLSLVEDERVQILDPHDRAAVSLPLTIDWRAEDLARGEGAGSFGVLVDRAPPPPGRSLAWLFRDADDCSGVTGCPDDAYLALRDVHHTTETSFVVDRVAPPASGHGRRFHEVTIVLLDGDGRRVGEAAWSVRFAVAEDG